MESRFKDNLAISSRATGNELPPDYLQMVRDVFTTHFDAGLKEVQKIQGKEVQFEPSGMVFTNEVVLGVSLVFKDQLAATTIYGSCDFDPKASAPTAPELLSHCVDAIGGLFLQLLDPEKPEILAQLGSESLSSLEGVPHVWTALEIEGRKVFLKVDKSNPLLDQMTDEWLLKNDPSLAEREMKEQQETEKFFFTGPKKDLPLSDEEDDDGGDPGSTVH